MNALERIFIGTFGLLLFGLGIYVFIFGEVSLAWRCLASILLVALGGNAIYGALVSKRPWISKVGPLP